MVDAIGRNDDCLVFRVITDVEVDVERISIVYYCLLRHRGSTHYSTNIQKIKRKA